LALPVVTGVGPGPAAPVTFTVDGGTATPADPSAPPTGVTSPDAPLAPGTTLTVTTDGDDALLDLVLGETTLQVRCGRDHWAEGVLGTGPGRSRGARGLPPGRPTPVVCRGGWTTADTFEADLVLVETPHRLRLTATGSSLRSAWSTVPLGGSRLEAHLPW
ncbi:MAG: hypothetical protein JWP82_1182, partial [Humibacillus sp.]|nr:hypothetical protein [Humibacillus sp.]